MKKATMLLTVVTTLMLLLVALPSFAKTKEITITGQAQCAKCALKETDKCQTVIQTQKGRKKVSYYLVNNDVAKGFHEEVCHGPKDVTATGTVKKVDGKNEFTATKIEATK